MSEAVTKPKRTRKPEDPLLRASIAQVMTELGVPADSWDVLIVGDGSGTTWKTACGWSAVIIDRRTNARQMFNGAANFGTNHIAELSAYVYALMWYANGPGKEALRAVGYARPGGHLAIHVVTDNQTIANQGNRLCSRDGGYELWAAIDAVVSRGYRLMWHWKDRNKLGLNRLTDHLSRQSRLAIEAIGPPEGCTIYDFNPNEQVLTEEAT